MGTSDVPIVFDVEGPLPDIDYSLNRLGSTDFTAAVRYKPFDDLTLRASYGTGFLPPALTQISQNVSVSSASIYNLVDSSNGDIPVTGDADGNLTVYSGGNGELKPENSKSLSFGAILTLSPLPGLRLSVDYTSIKKTDEILNALQLQYLILNEDRFPDRVIRDPMSGMITGLNGSSINLAESEVAALDFQFDYSHQIESFGEVHFYAVATHNTKSKRKTLPEDPFIDQVGFAEPGAPLDWQGNFGLDWNRGPLTVGWNTQYYSSYNISFADPDLLTNSATRIANQGAETISAQMYHDILFVYDVSNSNSPLLSGLNIAFGIQNVFDKKPPILATFSYEDTGGYSTYGDPRLRRFTLNIRKAF